MEVSVLLDAGATLLALVTAVLCMVNGLEPADKAVDVADNSFVLNVTTIVLLAVLILYHLNLPVSILHMFMVLVLTICIISEAFTLVSIQQPGLAYTEAALGFVIAIVAFYTAYRGIVRYVASQKRRKEKRAAINAAIVAQLQVDNQHIARNRAVEVAAELQDEPPADG